MHERLPAGTVTFLFTDIEGSTRLLHELGERYAEVRGEHRRVLRAAFARHGGVEVDTQGDSFFVAFTRASDAVTAALEAQAALAEGPVRVRMGVHTGEPLVTKEGYVGVDVHRAARIAAAGHGGQVLLSRATRDLVDVEVRDLGEHRLRDLLAPERIYQLGGVEFAPLKTLNQTNLPVQPTPLVGRERELAELLALVCSTRLLTLTGAGGTGKTRLALQLAAELVDEYRDGVWFVSLAALMNPSLVRPTIARALGLTEPEALEEYLDGRPLLLLLDNFEQVIEARVWLAALLRAVRDLKLIVTSRAPLHLSAEQVYVVPTLRDDEAITLFAARARAVSPSFEPDIHVAEICRRLDNLPLAIELAAARTTVLASEALLARLERRLPLLTVGAHDHPEKQRTLRATIDWSFDLLDRAEQRLFVELAVFAGSFALEAAEEVARADLDQLQSLIEKSLLRQTLDRRLFMLETVREYALERLESGHTDEPRRRHAAWYQRVASAEGISSRELDRELDNFRVALHFLMRDCPAAALQLAAELEPLWCGGHTTEGRSWLDATLSASVAAPGSAQAKALCAAGSVAVIQGDHAEALSLLQQSLELSRQQGEAAVVASALKQLGILSALRGERDKAHAYLDESLELLTELGDRPGIALVTNDLAILAAREGDLTAARTWHEENLRQRRRLGDPELIAASLLNLGYTAILQGDHDAAHSCLEEALALTREFGSTFDLAIVLTNLARVAINRGEIPDAEQQLSEALQTYAAARAPDRCAECLEGLAAVALATEQLERAARLLGAATRTRTSIGSALGPPEQQVVDDLAHRIQTHLNPGQYAAAWQEGQEMGLAEAIDYALMATNPGHVP